MRQGRQMADQLAVTAVEDDGAPLETGQAQATGAPEVGDEGRRWSTGSTWLP